MVKKSGKSKPKSASKPKSKPVSKKIIISPKESKQDKRGIDIIPEPKIELKDTLKELEILSEEKKMEKKLDRLQKEEEKIEGKEDVIESMERKIENEAEKVEKLEKGIKSDLKEKPLRKISFKDVNKGIIGAFIGVVAHYAFIYGREIAKDISMTRATILIIFSYFLIIILMYETGYREIREKRIWNIIPKRASVIYLTSIIVIIFIFFLFNQLDFSNWELLYREIAVTLVLASVGAGTADLIGKD